MQRHCERGIWRRSHNPLASWLEQSCRRANRLWKEPAGHPNRKSGYADPDDPPVASTIVGNENNIYNLAAHSFDFQPNCSLGISRPLCSHILPCGG